MAAPRDSDQTRITLSPRKFYGNRDTRRPRHVQIRDIPENSDDSELSSDENDGDDTWNPESSDSSGSDLEDSSHDGEDEQSLSQPGPSGESAHPRPSKLRARDVVWRQRENNTATEEPEFLGQRLEGQNPRQPIDYFRDFISDDILTLIVNESNQYALQSDITKPLSLHRGELEQFLGIIYYMSIVKMPRARLYWGTHTRCSQVADTVSLKRFEEIKSKLHFSNNEGNIGSTDKLAKVRPILDAFKNKVSSFPKSEKLCVDEQIVPFKGQSSLKQYNPKKPKKWGYKIFVCSGASGLIHDLEVYTGKIEPCPGQPDIGACGNIVLRLLQDTPRDVWHKLYIDNWFNSPALQIALWKQGIACVGTVRSNRLLGCTLPTDKEMSKRGRGASVLKTGLLEGVHLNVVKWHDNKSVTMLSTFAAVQPIREVERWDKRQKAMVIVQCPSIITLYNSFMGGVDLLDALVALYRNPIRSKKWYMRIVFHLFDLVAVQSWLLYGLDCDHGHIAKGNRLSLLQFKMEIAQCLMRQNKPVQPKRGRPSLEVEPQLQQKKRKGPTSAIPPLAVRTDNVCHFPMPVADKGRCKLPRCIGFSRFKCEKCNVNLCLTKKSNCFRKFHLP